MNIKLPSYDSLFDNDDLMTPAAAKKTVPIHKLVDFKEHPFRVVEDEAMDKLVDSIKTIGLQEPLIVRPSESKGTYEIISGHRRKHACLLAGITEIPVDIRQISDEEAVCIMVDANLKRETLLPSELAKAYKMKVDAKMKLDGTTMEDVVEGEDMSKASIYRYLKLSELTETLLDMVDKKRIQVVAGTTLTELEDFEQQLLQKYMQENEKSKVNKKKADALVMLSMNDNFNYQTIDDVLQKKPDQHKSKWPEEIRSFFPNGATDKQILTGLLDILNSQGEVINQQTGEIIESKRQLI